MKKVKNIPPKIVIFTAVKNRCMLHGRVFVMTSQKRIQVDLFMSTLDIVFRHGSLRIIL